MGTDRARWGGWTDLSVMNPPKSGGVYRVRTRRTDPPVIYIGETGNLRQRLHALRREVRKATRPGRTPHTAAPALWALVQLGSTLEVSYRLVDGDRRARRCAEALCLAAHIRAHGDAPWAQFGGGAD